MRRLRRHSDRHLPVRPTLRLKVGDRFLFGLTLATLLIACLFGGAPIRPGLALLAFWGSGLATLALAVARGAHRVPIGLPARLFLLLACLLPFAQLVPLPYTAWATLPGHDIARGTFAAVGIAGGYVSWSVTPVDTLMCGVLVFPLAGLFLAVLWLGDDEVDLLLLAIAGVVLLGLAAGSVQVATAGAALRFYAKADHGYLLGFFSNKNHSASLLAAAMILVAYSARRRTGVAAQRWLATGAGILLLFAAILATNSRAGLMLGGLSALLCIGGAVAGTVANRRLVGLSTAVAVVLGVGLFSFSGIAGRSIDRYGEVGQDRRWTIWTDTVVAIRDYMPLGSGLGSFVPVYRTVEPLSSVNPRYANHAHNDYLELALEGGIPALGLVALFVGVWGVASYRLLARLPSAPAVPSDPAARRRSRPAFDRRAGQALVGSGTILLILLHSLMDYPLRTATWSALVAICFGLLMRASAGSDREVDVIDDGEPMRRFSASSEERS